MSRLTTLAIAAFLGTSALADGIQNPLVDEGSWPDLEDDIVGAVPISDGTALFSINAPYRAHDAAVVPIVIEQLDDEQTITTMDLVVDENPAPLVAHMTFGPAMHPVKFETRVRVNLYSNVRAVAQTENGHFMNGRFVKASGGCSAPATRDPEEALAGMGEMRMRFFGDQPQASGMRREAQIMLRHPNYSGMQRDQISQLFIPAHFIDSMKVLQGDEVLFTMTGGISISENPVFRFEYTTNGADQIRVEATDTQGNIFADSFSAGM